VVVLAQFSRGPETVLPGSVGVSITLAFDAQYGVRHSPQSSQRNAAAAIVANSIVAGANSLERNIDPSQLGAFHLGKLRINLVKLGSVGEIPVVSDVTVKLAVKLRTGEIQRLAKGFSPAQQVCSQIADRIVSSHLNLLSFLLGVRRGIREKSASEMSLESSAASASRNSCKSRANALNPMNRGTLLSHKKV